MCLLLAERPSGLLTDEQSTAIPSPHTRIIEAPPLVRATNKHNEWLQQMTQLGVVQADFPFGLIEDYESAMMTNAQSTHESFMKFLNDVNRCGDEYQILVTLDLISKLMQTLPQTRVVLSEQMIALVSNARARTTDDSLYFLTLVDRTKHVFPFVTSPTLLHEHLKSCYETVIRLIKETRFDHTRRYLSAELNQLYKQDRIDPFYCNDLAEYIEAAAWLSEALELKDQTLWKRHLADYYSTNHICEDGYPRPFPEGAIALYRELGLKSDVKRAALMLADMRVEEFIFGTELFRPWVETNKPLEPLKLNEALVALESAGFSEREQKAYLTGFARDCAEAKYFAAAAELSREAADTAAFERYSKLAKELPVSQEQQMGVFLDRIANAEAHP